ncbi:MAG: TerD family protein [Clostridia bacterium]|nr:TerD family protein [Clostridia bacterium]
MAKLLVKGEKVIVNNIIDPMNSYVMTLTYRLPSGLCFDADLFIFMIEENSGISKDNILFYNKPKSMCESIRIFEYYNDQEHKKTVEVDFNKVPQNIKNLVVGCTVFEEGIKEQVYDDFDIKGVLMSKASGTEILELSEKVSGDKNGTVLFGDFYKHKDVWKFHAVKQGGKENILSMTNRIYNSYIY